MLNRFIPELHDILEEIEFRIVVEGYRLAVNTAGNQSAGHTEVWAATILAMASTIMTRQAFVFDPEKVIKRNIY